MANSRIVFILKRIPSMADPSINDVYPGEHFVTEDSGQLYYKDLQGIIVTVGGGKAAVPTSWVYTPSAKNFAFTFEGSNFLDSIEAFSTSIRFLTNSNTVINAGENTVTVRITKGGSTLTTRDFPLVDIIGRELRTSSIPANAICDILFDGTKFRVYNTYGFGSNSSDGSYYFDNNVVVDGSFTVINSNDKKGFVVLDDGTVIVGNDGAKLTNVTDLFQLNGNSTFDGDVTVTGKLTAGNRIYSSKGYDGILLSDIPTLDWTKLTNVLPQDKTPAVTDNSNKIATTKWVDDYIRYLGLTGGGEGGNSAVIDTVIKTFTATDQQTEFIFDYNIDSLLVMHTGALLVNGEDYTATDGVKIVFTEGCDIGDEITLINIGKLDQEKYLTADQINAIITGSNFATVTYVQEQIDELIGGSGEALDTLKELADALNNDPDFAANIANQLAGKADKVHTHKWSDITSGVPNATENALGLVQLLSSSEAVKGIDTSKAMHAAGTKSLIRQSAFDGFKGQVTLTADTTLTKDSIGRWNRVSMPGVTITLPKYTELDVSWSVVPIYNFSSGSITVKCPTPSAGFPANNGIIQSITLDAYSSVICICEGSSSSGEERNWNMYGDGAIKYSNGFKKVFNASSGYQMLPSGLIIQWGIAVGYFNTISTINFPIPFPNAALQGTVCHNVAAINSIDIATLSLGVSTTTFNIASKRIMQADINSSTITGGTGTTSRSDLRYIIIGY